MVMKIFDGTVFLAEGTADTKGLFCNFNPAWLEQNMQGKKK
jgi:hypothetical protein